MNVIEHEYNLTRIRLNGHEYIDTIIKQNTPYTIGQYGIDRVVSVNMVSIFKSFPEKEGSENKTDDPSNASEVAQSQRGFLITNNLIAYYLRWSQYLRRPLLLQVRQTASHWIIHKLHGFIN